MAGSHIDIAPTLIDLAAPAGFKYASFGENILDPRREPVGFGQYVVITPDWVFRGGEPQNAQALDGKRAADAASAEFLDTLSHRQRVETALGWWRLMEGPTLPGAETIPPLRLTTALSTR